MLRSDVIGNQAATYVYMYRLTHGFRGDTGYTWGWLLYRPRAV